MRPCAQNEFISWVISRPCFLKWEAPGSYRLERTTDLIAYSADDSSELKPLRCATSWSRLATQRTGGTAVHPATRHRDLAPHTRLGLGSALHHWAAQEAGPLENTTRRTPAVKADDVILISVDDHIAEPADMFEQDLPAQSRQFATRDVQRRRKRLRRPPVDIPLSSKEELRSAVVLSRRQSVDHREELEPRARSAFFRQRLIFRIVVPALGGCL